jgi:hypothetical protein
MIGLWKLRFTRRTSGGRDIHRFRDRRGYFAICVNNWFIISRQRPPERIRMGN